MQRKVLVFTLSLAAFSAAFLIPSVAFEDSRALQLRFADRFVVSSPVNSDDDDVPCLKTDAYRAQGFPIIYRIDIEEPCGNARTQNHLAMLLDVAAAAVNALAVMYLYTWWTDRHKTRGHRRKAGARP